MTAPIVTHDTRRAMTEIEITGTGAIMSNARRRPLYLEPRLVAGDLWERLAELDVERHGEPRVLSRDGIMARGGSIRSLSILNSDWHGFVADLIERRRPVMRAARAELDALTSRRLEPEPYRCEVCEEHGVDECPAPPPA